MRLPNGVDTERFRPADKKSRQDARAALGLPRDSTIIAYVGRVAPRKDTRTLVAAYLRLLARGDKEAHLVIAGDGHELPQLRALVDDAKRSRRVTFLGEVDHVHPVLAATDIFVHPSRREGMPNVVLEAMATGLAVVLSDIEAHTEMLAGRPAALTYRVGDEAALAARLAGLVQSPNRRVPLAAAARELALERYNIDGVCGAYDELYAKLSAGDVTQGRSASQA